MNSVLGKIGRDQNVYVYKFGNTLPSNAAPGLMCTDLVDPSPWQSEAK